jgi:hypothetical protein
MGAGEGFEKTWQYSGLVVHLCRTTDDPKFHVFHWIATSRKWNSADGIGVGSSVSAIVRKFGRHERASKDEAGFDVLHYAIRDTDGFLWFRTRRGFVVEMGMVEDWS